MTRKQSLPLSVKDLFSEHLGVGNFVTSSGYIATRCLPRRQRPTSLKLERGRSEGCIQAEDITQQATLNASQSGTGCKRSVFVARPSHLGAVIAARPRIRDMVRDATIAGLTAARPPLARWDDLVETDSAAFLDTLNDSESPTACF